MDGVEGLGRSFWSAYSPATPARRVAEEPSNRPPIEAPESGAGLGGALEMGRKFLSENLSDAGFMDIHAGAVTRLRTFLALGLQEPEPLETGLDLRMAGELANLMGSEVSREVNLVLRILARVDPGRVATLLR